VASTSFVSSTTAMGRSKTRPPKTDGVKFSVGSFRRALRLKIAVRHFSNDRKQCILPPLSVFTVCHCNVPASQLSLGIPREKYRYETKAGLSGTKSNDELIRPREGAFYSSGQALGFTSQMPKVPYLSTGERAFFPSRHYFPDPLLSPSGTDDGSPADCWLDCLLRLLLTRTHARRLFGLCKSWIYD